MVVETIGSHDELQTAIDIGQPIVLACYATWCEPCTAIKPQILTYGAKYSHVGFLSMDVDEYSGETYDLDVKVLPTFLFFNDGKKLSDEVKGANPQGVEDAIKRNFPIG